MRWRYFIYINPSWTSKKWLWWGWVLHNRARQVLLKFRGSHALCAYLLELWLHMQFILCCQEWKLNLNARNVISHHRTHNIRKRIMYILQRTPQRVEAHSRLDLSLANKDESTYTSLSIKLVEVRAAQTKKGHCSIQKSRLRCAATHNATCSWQQSDEVRSLAGYYTWRSHSGTLEGFSQGVRLDPDSHSRTGLLMLFSHVSYWAD